MKKLHFNFKDLFRAPRLALSLQRIWINSLGLLAGYLIYLIFGYLSLLISGYSFTTIWFRFGLLPCAFGFSAPWYGIVLYLIGLFLFLATILMTNTAVSRAVYMVLRDELFYTWTQAYKFALRKWISVVGAMFTFALMIAFMIVGAIVLGFIARIPYLGELGTALFSLPLMFAALMLLFIGVVFVVGIFFVPAIIATSDEDALGGVFQSFSITFNQFWRILVYGTIVAVLEVVGILIFAAVVKLSYLTFVGLFTIGMGEKMVQLSEYALHLLDKAVPAIYQWTHLLPWNLGDYIYLAQHHPAPASLSGLVAFSSYILAFFLILGGGIVLAYGEAIGNAGLTLIYIVLYKIQEDENLLEREDDELKEEEEEEEETTEQTEESEEAKDQKEENKKEE